MATAPKSLGKHDSQAPQKPLPLDDQQLRRDRLVGVLVLLAIVALIALMIWLATLGEAPQDVDYWPMMP